MPSILWTAVLGFTGVMLAIHVLGSFIGFRGFSSGETNEFGASSARIIFRLFLFVESLYYVLGLTVMLAFAPTFTILLWLMGVMLAIHLTATAMNESFGTSDQVKERGFSRLNYAVLGVFDGLEFVALLFVFTTLFYSMPVLP